jgi:demethylmenaquinone methyltransferase/2-methoxy-6-polyprenyl-1,4-benzoquinol methylase
MAFRSSGNDVDRLLAEQIAYYRARAPEYAETAIPDISDAGMSKAWQEISAALAAVEVTGDVLELACGPGIWTGRLLETASSVTAVDASPEMLAIAEAKVDGPRARFICADLFSWAPERRYDLVFFGFWLSHVPLERFDAFWEMVERCLRPDGRVVFVDDAYRTDDELIEGPQSSLIQRVLNDGTAHRAVKVPHTPKGLEDRLARLGWRIIVRSMPGPFFFGMGTPVGRGTAEPSASR